MQYHYLKSVIPKRFIYILMFLGCTKIDAVIVKLEGMEKNKAKKREAMSRILEQMDDGEEGN